MKLDRDPGPDLAQAESDAAVTGARADERGGPAWDGADELLDLRLLVTTNRAHVERGHSVLAWRLHHVRLTTAATVGSRACTGTAAPVMRMRSPRLLGLFGGVEDARDTIVGSRSRRERNHEERTGDEADRHRESK